MKKHLNLLLLSFLFAISTLGNNFDYDIKNLKLISESQRESISDFIKSPQFINFGKTDLYTNLCLNECKLTDAQFVNQNNKEVAILRFFKKDKIVAILEYIKFNDYFKTTEVKNPYFINFQDYSNTDIIAQIGKIYFYDIAAGNLKTRSYTIETQTYEELLLELPIEIRNVFIETFPENPTSTHYCDLNHNGNVSYSECYTCMTGACRGNKECKDKCWGNSLPMATQCEIAFELACAWISIWY